MHIIASNNILTTFIGVVIKELIEKSVVTRLTVSNDRKQF